jgi:hypothetical protein
LTFSRVFVTGLQEEHIMAGAFKEIEVLDDLYTSESPSEINLKRLATLLDLNDKDVAEAFKLDPTAVSKSPYASSNPVLKQWMNVFNLVIRIISESEPDLGPVDTKIKMQRWLKLPRPEFGGNSAVDEMRRGKARRVKNLLEQLAG